MRKLFLGALCALAWVGVARAQVAGSYGSATVALSTPTSAYATGQVVGGLETFAGMAQLPGLVSNVQVNWGDAQTGPFDLYLFRAAPSGASVVADHSALSIAPADVGLLLGVVHLTDCTVQSGTLGSQCQAVNPQVPFPGAANGPLYGVLVARVAFTPASATDASVTLTANY